MKFNKQRTRIINEKIGNKILEMRKLGFGIREIARAMKISHPAIIYFIKVAEPAEPAKNNIKSVKK